MADSTKPAISVVTSVRQGRFVIAARDLRPGETVLETHVCCFATYPRYRANFCDWCLWNSEHPLQYSCKNCLQVFFCSEECQADGHSVHRWICEPFSFLEKALEEEDTDEELVHQSRFLLRYLGEYITEAVSNSPRKDVSGLLSLVGHQEHLSEYENWLFSAVARVVLKTCTPYVDGNKNEELCITQQRILKPMLQADCVIRLLSIARCNRFGLFGYGEDCAGTVMSLPASYFNHNCLPTAAVSFERRYCKFVTTCAVAKGEELAINYLPMAADPTTREAQLQKEYFFKCTCKLCTLPEGSERAELERKKKSMMCPECTGLLLPLLEPPNTKRCRNCYKQIET